jgi:tetratricopeptide (TPR) repeat protein
MRKPKITKTTHILPFGELSPEQFERLCLWLVEREGYLRVEHLGESGGESGRDLIAFYPSNTGEQLWYFQCKRYKRINSKQLFVEVDKYNRLVQLDPTKKPYGMVFVSTANISARTRERVREYSRNYGYACVFWARTELDMLVKKHDEIVIEFFDSVSPSLASDEVISIAHLPSTGGELFGRQAELELLDNAWENPHTHIVSFVAWGGVGKTALVNHWLKRQMAHAKYRGADRVYAWSFYSQGTSERIASADLFIDQALRWFGDRDPEAGSPWEKGERLARHIRKSRTLLILDGVEPLQHAPGPQEGYLKDAALQALLVELAGHQLGLCVITTRLQVRDLVEFEKSTVIQAGLDRLSSQAGTQILRSFDVRGDEDELAEAANEYEGHALALTLLGSYLADVCGGDIRRRTDVPFLQADVRHGGHAEKVIRAYERWLGRPELAVLRLTGLFDRPAEPEQVSVLRTSPPIQGLTDGLEGISEAQWQQTLAKLRRVKLITTSYSRFSAVLQDVVDAHPLVREHFRQQLKTENPEAWREANSQLYDYLIRNAKTFPETIDEMAPLFDAVTHGCEAERYQETFDDVYKKRIQRGQEYFDLYKLNAFGADLAAMTHFFIFDRGTPNPSLSENAQAELLSIRGYNLRSLGRLRDAATQIKLALEFRKRQGNWKDAAINAGNLSRVYLVIGDLAHALAIAREGVALSDDSRDIHEQMGRRAILADVLHQCGQQSAAANVFEEAERLQPKRTPPRLVLDSLAGFWYCQLLLAQRKYDEVINRANQTIEIAKKNNWPIDIAIDCLSLACAYLYKAKEFAYAQYSQAEEFLDRAVTGLRLAGTMDYIPLALLTRAELHRLKGSYENAERDLEEVLRIARRGEMGLYLADYHLESARLCLARDDQNGARENWRTATAMIDRMDYHRRDKELDDIQKDLN